MARRWIARAIKRPGSLRRALGAKKGKPIPLSKLRRAAKGKGVTARRARFALQLRKMRRR